MKCLFVAVLVAACGGTPAKPIAHPDATAPAKPKEPSTAEEVIEASIVAEGGRDTLAKVTSIHATGSVVIQGVKGQLEAFSTPPNNSLQRLVLPGIANIEQGVAGDLVWEKNTLQGARIITGREKAHQLIEATFNGDLEWKKLFPKAELKGLAKFADTDCYKVELTGTDGVVQTRYYARDTHLPTGVEMVAPSQMGDLPVKSVSRDWREVNGIKYPHKVSHEEAGQAFDILLDKLETNVPIPPATFEPPDDIKQMAAAQK